MALLPRAIRRFHGFKWFLSSELELKISLVSSVRQHQFTVETNQHKSKHTFFVMVSNSELRELVVNGPNAVRRCCGVNAVLH